MGPVFKRLRNMAAAILILAVLAAVASLIAQPKRLGSLVDSIRAARFLLRNLSTRPASASIRETTLRTAAGTSYDLYTPAGTIRKTVLLVTGLTTLCERDERIVNFARAGRVRGQNRGSSSAANLLRPFFGRRHNRDQRRGGGFEPGRSRKNRGGGLQRGREPGAERGG